MQPIPMKYVTLRCYFYQISEFFADNFSASPKKAMSDAEIYRLRQLWPLANRNMRSDNFRR